MEKNVKNILYSNQSWLFFLTLEGLCTLLSATKVCFSLKMFYTLRELFWRKWSYLVDKPFMDSLATVLARTESLFKTISLIHLNLSQATPFYFKNYVSFDMNKSWERSISTSNTDPGEFFRNQRQQHFAYWKVRLQRGYDHRKVCSQNDDSLQNCYCISQQLVTPRTNVRKSCSYL